MLIMGKTLTNYTQCVSYPTREDLVDVNVKDAYNSSPLSPLGRSDNNLVHLKQCYVPLVKRQLVTTRTVMRWSEESWESVRGCFEVTDWKALMKEYHRHPPPPPLLAAPHPSVRVPLPYIYTFPVALLMRTMPPLLHW